MDGGKRQLIIAGQLAAAAAFLGLHGRARFGALLAHNFLWLYPSLRRNCDWHGEVLTRFVTARPEVWLTIDDGPDPRDTPDILDLLAKHGAKATFFVIGHKARQHPDLCRRIVEEGHTLGNHTYSHASGAWWAYPGPCVQREISQGQEAIAEASGFNPVFFRSPVGMNNVFVHPAAAQCGLRVTGWSAAGKDGCPAAPSQIVARIRRRLAPGAIVLLHESGRIRRRALTLARLLECLGREGYRCVLPPEASLR